MLYVSEIQKNAGAKLYGITDTDDGITEYYTPSILKKILKANPEITIEGISGGKIKVVSMGKTVVGDMLSQTQSQMQTIVNSWDYQTCEEVARKNSFVRKIKPLIDNPDQYHELVMSYVFPQSVQDVIKQANEYTNQVHNVDVRDKNALKSALKSNMCLILQLSTKGTLTAFIGTASLNVLDSIYGVGYFDAFYLTKNLFGYTYNIERVRTNYEPNKKPKNSAMKSVFSGSLRFRASGKNHDGADLELSSPMYTVNLDNLIGLFVLDNPASMNKYNVIDEFNNSSNKGVYNFDIQLWNDVLQCCEEGSNYFGNEDHFLRYVDTENLEKAIDIGAVIQKFQSDFDFMESIRGRGFSFND